MFVSIYYKPSLFKAHTMILIVHIFMNVNKLCLNQGDEKEGGLTTTVKRHPEHVGLPLFSSRSTCRSWQERLTSRWPSSLSALTLAVSRRQSQWHVQQGHSQTPNTGLQSSFGGRRRRRRRRRVRGKEEEEEEEDYQRRWIRPPGHAGLPLLKVDKQVEARAMLCSRSVLLGLGCVTA